MCHQCWAMKPGFQPRIFTSEGKNHGNFLVNIAICILRFFLLIILGNLHQAPHPHSPPSRSISSSHPCNIPSNHTPQKTIESKTKSPHKPTSFLHLSNTPPFILVALRVVVSHTTFCPSSPTHKMFIAMNRWPSSSFLTHHYHWILTETPLRHPVLRQVTESLQFLVHKASPFMHSSGS